MSSILASIRIAAATMLLCVVGYSATVWGIAQAIAPGAANGSLIRSADGTVIGSRLVAQGFTRPEYFWPRPSAVDYNAAGAGGSNLSPASEGVADRGREMVERYGATSGKPLPADLAAASGAGLDPHISEAGAMYQAVRVAKARGLEPSEVEALVRREAFFPGGLLTQGRIVNVLELNLALDML